MTNFLQSFVPVFLFAAVLCGCSKDSNESPADGGRVDSGTSDLPMTACTSPNECTPINCVCSSATDVCAGSATSFTVRGCEKGACLTDPARDCACAPGKYNGVTLPVATPLGSAWSNVPVPSPVDTVLAAVGTADDVFTVLTASGYPLTESIRSKIWSYTGAAFTDVTPARFVTLPAGTTAERGSGLALRDTSTLELTTNGTMSGSTAFGTAYQLSGTTATVQALPGAPTQANKVVQSGVTTYVGGLSGGHPAMYSIIGSMATALVLPPSVAAVSSPIGAMAGPDGRCPVLC